MTLTHRRISHAILHRGRGHSRGILRLHHDTALHVHMKRHAGTGIFKVLYPAQLPAREYPMKPLHITKGRQHERLAGISGVTGDVGPDGHQGYGRRQHHGGMISAMHRNTAKTFGPYGSVSGQGVLESEIDRQRFGKYGSRFGGTGRPASSRKHLSALLKGLRV